MKRILVSKYISLPFQVQANLKALRKYITTDSNPGELYHDTAEKSQSSRHIPCAVHLEYWQKLDCGRHGGACLHLLSAVSTITRSVMGTIPIRAWQRGRTSDEPLARTASIAWQRLDLKAAKGDRIAVAGETDVAFSIV
jgi:hypothetical protein